MSVVAAALGIWLCSATGTAQTPPSTVLTVVGESQVSVSGTIETSVADLLDDGTVDTNTSFELAGSVASDGLFLPDTLERRLP